MCQLKIFILLTIISIASCQKKPSAQYESVYATGVNTNEQIPDYIRDDNSHSTKAPNDYNAISDNNYVVEVNNYTLAKGTETYVTQAKVKDGYIQQIKLTNNAWLHIHKINTHKINITTRECSISNMSNFDNCTIKILH